MSALVAGAAGSAAMLFSVAAAMSARRPSILPVPLGEASAAVAISGGDARLGRRQARRQARKRAAAVEREVPQLLDLLAVGSGAGLSAEAALRRASSALRGPLGADLEVMFGQVDLGLRWRDALKRYALDSGSRDLRRSVAVLERTERLGSSLQDATCELAESVRQARRAGVVERARTAPVKMLFPLVFLILPAFLLLTVVPVLLTTIRSIG